MLPSLIVLDLIHFNMQQLHDQWSIPTVHVSLVIWVVLHFRYWHFRVFTGYSVTSCWYRYIVVERAFCVREGESRWRKAFSTFRPSGIVSGSPIRLLVEMLLHVKIHLWPDFYNHNYGIIIRQLVIDYSGDHCFPALIKNLTNISPIHSWPKCGKSLETYVWFPSHC